MPPKETVKEDAGAKSAASGRPTRMRTLFSIPSPVRDLFDKVPVLVYPSIVLPQGAPRPSRIPSLYIFSTEKEAAAARPSFNPTCLKWQTFLNIAGIDHRLVSSNNHASPTGSLPFLLPAIYGPNTSQEASLPIVPNKLVKYALKQGATVKECTNIRYEAYQALLDHRIRNCWLYTLYLEPDNFSTVAYPLYVASTSSNPLVRAAISRQLRTAAESELLKHTSIIDTDDLYSEADKAFEALSILLGGNRWFFNSKTPGLFDASVFAYTHLLLDGNLDWREQKLCRALRSKENLVQHRERLRVRYYGD